MDYSIEVTQTQDRVLKFSSLQKISQKGKIKISPSRLSLTGSSRSSIAWYLGCISPSETKCCLSKKFQWKRTYGGNSVVCDENLGDHPRPAESLDQLLGRGRALQTSLVNYNPVVTFGSVWYSWNSVITFNQDNWSQQLTWMVRSPPHQTMKPTHKPFCNCELQTKFQNLETEGILNTERLLCNRCIAFLKCTVY